MRTIWILAALMAVLLTPCFAWAEGDSEGYRPGDEAMVPPQAEQHEYPAPRDGVDGTDGTNGQDGATGPQGQPGAAGASGVVVYHHYTHRRIYLRPTPPPNQRLGKRGWTGLWEGLHDAGVVSKSYVDSRDQEIRSQVQTAQSTANSALATARIADQRVSLVEARIAAAAQSAKKAQAAVDNRQMAWTALALIGAALALLLVGGGIYALARR